MGRLIGVLLGIFLGCVSALASSPKAPTPLQEWRDWVLHDTPNFTCPFQYNQSQKTCEWSAGLQLQVTDTGGEFHYAVTVFADDWIVLPGSRETWPQTVTDRGQALAVVDKQGLPRVFLNAGAHQLRGKFVWTELPRTLAVPPRAGLLQLTVRQHSVTTPVYENAGLIWLTRAEAQATTAERDSLEIKVFRLFSDTNPARVETRLDIEVSGQEREITTGPLLLPGFTIEQFTSDSPARIEPDGQLRMQAKPGRWQIGLLARHSQPLLSAQFAPLNEAWPSQEIWTFAAQPLLRTVELSGLASIDPSQTQLPAEWRQYPSFLAEAGQSLSFTEQHRGNQSERSNQLTLNKTLWLDFSGQAFTVRDQITGQFQQGRLTAHSDYQLARAEQAGTPLLISELPGAGASGVEVRDQALNLMAVSRLHSLKQQPTSGWVAEFTAINTDLLLPPGWSLFHASGADWVDGSWVSQWNLWHIFLFLLLVVALARSFSWQLGVLALVTLLLTYHRQGAPLFIWFNFAALYALKPFVEGRVVTWLRGYGIACALLCLLILLPFMVAQVRLAIYPQSALDTDYGYQTNSYKSAEPALYEERNQGESETMVEEIIVQGVRSGGADGDDEFSAPQRLVAKRQVNNSISSSSRYDLGQKIQVGPGLPDWSWQSINLSWSGPVTTSEEHQLWLIAPLWNRLGYLLAAFLPLLMLGLILRQLYHHELEGMLRKVKTHSAGAIVVLLMLGSFSSGQDAQAQVVITEEILDEYQQRLLAEPDCMPNCGAIEAVELTLTPEKMTLTMVVHSAVDMAFPLPAGQASWLPETILLNNQPASWLQSRNGQIYIRLLAGRHELQLGGHLRGHEQLALSFLADLHNVSVRAEGWRVSGVPSSGQNSQALQLQRLAQVKVNNEQRLLADPIAPYVIITRNLVLGLDWRLTTEVERVAPARGAIHLAVPLLAGEAPSSGNVDAGGNMLVVLGEDQNQFVWQSTLKPSDQLTLIANSNPAWSEMWTLTSSTLWHPEVSGIPARADSGHSSAWVWLPWADEQVVIQVQKPAAVPGQHLSIDAVELRQSLGKRAHDSQLSMTLRANQGSRYPLTLPAGAQFKKLLLDGRETPVSQNQNQLLIPITPGQHQVEIHWLQEQPIAIRSETDSVDLGMAASNIRLQLELPQDRWLLLVGGPRLGPAILFWGVLLVVLVIAVILGRLKITPLNSLQWVLLSLGVATINLYLLMLIALWFVALYIRSRKTTAPASHPFNLAQICLLLYSVIALGALVASVPASLLSNPDMMLTGNNSYISALRWYQDLSDGPLPSAFAISLPILYYRIAMLLWSIWLAFALMRWIPWAWRALTSGGFWFTPAPAAKASADTTKKEP